MRSKEILEEIKERCPIKLGDLVWAGGGFDDAGNEAPDIMCLVESLSPANDDAFDRAYEGAKSPDFPIGSFVDYACNMKKV